MGEDLFYVNLFGDLNVRTVDGPRLIGFDSEFELDGRSAAKALAGRLSVLAEMGFITIHPEALKLEV